MQQRLKDFEVFGVCQRVKIYQALRNQKFVPTYIMRNLASQYNARIKELREDGVAIESCQYNIDGRKVWGFRII